MARPVWRRPWVVLGAAVVAVLALGPWGLVRAAAAGLPTPPPSTAPTSAPAPTPTSAPAPTPPSAPAAGAAGDQATVGAVAPATPAASPAPAQGAGGSSGTLAKVLGLAALLIVLVLYTEGFGVLGGRVRPLSARRPARQAGGRSEPA